MIFRHAIFPATTEYHGGNDYSDEDVQKCPIGCEKTAPGVTASVHAADVTYIT